MPSLNDCLKLHKVSAKEAKYLNALKDGYIDEKYSASEADRMAIDAYTQELQANLESIHQQAGVPMERPTFVVEEHVTLNSPHNPGAPSIVSYRGQEGGKAVVWSGRTQFMVPMEWLSKAAEDAQLGPVNQPQPKEQPNVRQQATDRRSVQEPGQSPAGDQSPVATPKPAETGEINLEESISLNLMRDQQAFRRWKDRDLTTKERADLSKKMRQYSAEWGLEERGAKLTDDELASAIENSLNERLEASYYDTARLNGLPQTEESARRVFDAVDKKYWDGKYESAPAASTQEAVDTDAIEAKFDAADDLLRETANNAEGKSTVMRVVRKFQKQGLLTQEQVDEAARISRDRDMNEDDIQSEVSSQLDGNKSDAMKGKFNPPAAPITPGQAALKRMAKRRAKLGMNPVFDMAADAVDSSIYGAELMMNGVKGLSEWGSAMVEKFGESIRPYLAELFNMAKAKVNEAKDYRAAVREAEKRVKEVAMNNPEALRLEIAVDKEGQARVEGVEDADGNPVIDKETGRQKMRAMYVKKSYALLKAPGQPKVYKSKVMRGADLLEAELKVYLQNPEVMAGKGWYQRMRKRLQTMFGAGQEMIGQLLGATSARTPVAINWNQTIEASKQLSSGAYDALLERYHEFVLETKALVNEEKIYNDWKKDNKDKIDSEFDLRREYIKANGPLYAEWRKVYPNKRDSEFNLNDQYRKAINKFKEIPLRQNGMKFNANSPKVLQAMYGNWLSQTKGPKTPNYSGNLTGRTLKATIDVWAARTLRRLLYSGEVKKWRLHPEQEGGVTYTLSKDNVYGGDFIFGQDIFEEVSRRTGIAPDDLQAIIWFAEKDLWEKNGWTVGQGAEKSDLKSASDDVSTERYQAGVTTETAAGYDPAKQEQARSDIRRTMRNSPGMIASRVAHSQGLYMFTPENALDTEWTMEVGSSVDTILQSIIDVGRRENQNDVFISKLVDKTHPNARPIMEIGFKSPMTDLEIGAIMAMFRNEGIDGFTVARDTQGRAIGLRTQYVPEFAGNLDPAGHGIHTDKWIDNARKAYSNIDKENISHATESFVSTVVFGKEEYSNPIPTDIFGGDLAQELGRRKPIDAARSAAAAGASAGAGEGQVSGGNAAQGGADTEQGSGAVRPDDAGSERTTDRGAERTGGAAGPSRLVSDESLARAEQTIREKNINATALFDPEHIAALVKWTVGKLERKASTFGEWSADALKEHGEGIRAYLQQIWDAAQRQLKSGADSDQEDTVSAKNSSIDAERESRGQEPIEKKLRKDWETIWDQAVAISVNPDRVNKLIESYRKKPRAFESEVDQAVILHERMVIQNSLDANLHNANKALDSMNKEGADEAMSSNSTLEQNPESFGSEVASAMLSNSSLAEKLDTIDAILKQSGSATGGVLNARKMAIAEDFSLARMAMRERAMGDGKMTIEQATAKVKPEFDKIEATKKAIEAKIERDRISAMDEMMKRFDQMIADRERKVTVAKKPAADPTLVAYVKDRGAEARARIAARRAEGRTNANPFLDPEVMKDALIIGVEHLVTFANDHIQWGKAMVADFGADIAPHLPELYFKSENELNKTQKRVHSTPEEQKIPNLVTKMKAKVAEAEAEEAPISIKDLGNYVQKLAMELVADGITDREKLIDAVHENVKEIMPEVSRDEVMDAISGYGVMKKLSKDEVSVRLRDLKGQMQQLGKLRDMAMKLAPKKTGIERRDQSKEERDLIKLVEEAKKKGGYNVTDPETQLKTSLQATKTRLQNSIDDLQAQIDSRTKTIKTKTPPPSDSEVETLRAKQAKLREEYDKIFGKVGMTDEQRLTAIEKATDRQIVELQRQLRTNEVFTRAHEVQPTNPAIEAKRAILEQLKAERENARHILQPKESRTKEMIAIDAMRVRLQKGIAEYTRRLVEDDLSKAPPRRPYALDPEMQALKAAHEAAKQKFADRMRLAELNNRPRWVKGLDFVAKWFRAAALSSPVTFAKLALATAWQGGVHPFNEMAGAIYSKAFPKLADKATIEGGEFETRAMARAAVKGMLKGWDDMRNTLSKEAGNRSELDVLYGKHGHPAEAIELFGLLHGAEKAFLKRGMFEYAMEKQAIHALKHGIDMTDPAVQMRMGIEAYKYGTRAIFQENNMVSDMYSRAQSRLRETSRITGRQSTTGLAAESLLRSSLPVTKVATNIVAQSFEYAFGSARGGIELARAYARGIEMLEPAEANMIMRHLKKGSVGAAILLAGFLLPHIFGGFYRRGEKRSKKDIQPAEIKSPVALPHWMSKTGELPSYALHAPMFEVAQLGSTIRRVSDSKLRKRDEETQGLANGVLAAVWGLVKETPFVKEAEELFTGAEPGQGDDYLGKFAAGGVPQFVQFIARKTDKDENGDTVKRKPEGFLQQIQMGIPGLRKRIPEAGAPTNANTEFSQIATEWKDASGVVAPDPDRYKNIRYAIERGEADKAEELIRAQLKTKKAGDLKDALRNSENRYFTGNYSNDKKLTQILTPEEAKTRDEALKIRKDTTKKMIEIINQIQQEASVKN